MRIQRRGAQENLRRWARENLRAAVFNNQERSRRGAHTSRVRRDACAARIEQPGTSRKGSEHSKRSDRGGAEGSRRGVHFHLVLRTSRVGGHACAAGVGGLAKAFESRFEHSGISEKGFEHSRIFEKRAHLANGQECPRGARTQLRGRRRRSVRPRPVAPGTRSAPGMCKGQGSEFRVQGSEFRVLGSWFRVQGSGFRVQGSGFRVQSSGFRVQGSGFTLCVRIGKNCQSKNPMEPLKHPGCPG